MSWFYSHPSLEPETILWISNANANGGTFASDSILIANNLVKQLKLGTYYSKIVYMLPLLGSNLATALTPLINVNSFSRPTNSNFVDGDYSQSTGLKGNGTNKILDLNFKPSQLGSSMNCGVGYCENDMDFTGTSTQNPVGCTDNATTQYFQIQFFSGNTIGFFCGVPTSGAQTNNVAVNSRYYGQRSTSVDRDLYQTGVNIAGDHDLDTAASLNERNIYLMGVNNASAGTLYWKGRCGCNYFTNGTLTPTEVAAMDVVLEDYLFTPTGRPTP